MIRVGVFGFRGRMGREVVLAVNEAADMEYSGGADPSYDGKPMAGSVLTHSVDDLLERVDLDVVVDFSVPAVVVSNVRSAIAHAVPCVVGTTGLSATDRKELGDAASKKGIGLLVAPNFAIGAVLMMEFARMAAEHFQGVEIIELHHDRKLDAPSGTALLTAEKIREARPAVSGTPDDALPARGHLASGIPVHSVRLPGLVAHQEVIFGNPGEGLTIRHDSFDRKCFMPGVLMGIRGILNRQGLVFGLEHLVFG